MPETGIHPDTDLPEPVIKVCGITCLEDALASIELGANALGFNFYPPSPRFIEPARAARILVRLPSTLMVAAVIVLDSTEDPRLQTGRRDRAKRSGSMNRPDSERQAILDGLPERIDWLQVHGARRPADLQQLDRKVLVATSPKFASEFVDFSIIIDTSWGTGQLADWEALKELDRHFILSGGLTPENVKEALEDLQPSGVDVCSGVEKEPGRKDLNRLARFLEAVRTHYGLDRP